MACFEVCQGARQLGIIPSGFPASALIFTSQKLVFSTRVAPGLCLDQGRKRVREGGGGIRSRTVGMRVEYDGGQVNRVVDIQNRLKESSNRLEGMCI